MSELDKNKSSYIGGAYGINSRHGGCCSQAPHQERSDLGSWFKEQLLKERAHVSDAAPQRQAALKPSYFS